MLLRVHMGYDFLLYVPHKKRMFVCLDGGLFSLQSWMHFGVCVHDSVTANAHVLMCEKEPFPLSFDIMGTKTISRGG